MKKVIIAGILVLAGLGVFAQAGTGYVAVLPGYQFNTGSYTYNYQGLMTKAKGEGNFVTSLDFGYFFTDKIGIHAGYMYDKGDYKASLSYPPFFYTPSYKFSRQVNLFEVGPEFVGQAGQNGQIYGQINVGYTFGGTNTKFYLNGQRYDLGNVGSNEWAFGGALGYRYFFNSSVGLGLQATYHHINKWEVNDFWDARLGIWFKF